MAVIAAITFTLSVMFSMNYFNTKIVNLTEREKIFEKVANIDAIVRSEFLWDIEDEELYDSLARGYVEGMGDNFARYFNLKELQNHEQIINGVLVGVGITISKDESGYFKIESLYDNSPAQEEGLAAGDLIIEVDREDLSQFSAEEVTAMIQGEQGARITLRIRRDNTDTEYTMTRREITIDSIKYKMIGDAAYIKINVFNKKTADQYNNAIKDCKQKGATGIIIDLRNNPGGDLTGVCEVLKNILPEGPIAFAEYKDGRTVIVQSSDGRREESLPITVLGNGLSASAAELMIAALKDYEKADFIGTTTYGKGVMQATMKLKDGSAVQMTIAKYNSPLGENFHEVGIVPHYEVALTLEQEQDLASGIMLEESDPQIEKAIEILNFKK